MVHKKPQINSNRANQIVIEILRYMRQIEIYRNWGKYRVTLQCYHITLI